MGSLEHRLERLEGMAGLGRYAPCPKCGRRIPYIIREGGKISYPFGKPCGSCEGPSGVRVIRIVMEGDDGD